MTQAGTRPRGRGRPCCWRCAAVPDDTLKKPHVVLCGRRRLGVVHRLGYSVAVMLSNIASHAGRKASRLSSVGAPKPKRNASPVSGRTP